MSNAQLQGFERAFNTAETGARERMAELIQRSPIPDDEKADNLALFSDHILTGRVLFLNELYQKILNVPGVIVELGTRWGQDLAILSNLRALYEPTHHLRRIVGFDTFEGFVDVAPEDGNPEYAQPGFLRTADRYDSFLTEVMAANEGSKPLAQKQKFEIVRGDARQTLEEWLERNPQTIIAMAYFDMDLYSPTRRCLELIRPHLTKGSVVVLDELNDTGFPGETVALREAFGLGNIRLQRVPYLTYPSYFVFEGD